MLCQDKRQNYHCLLQTKDVSGMSRYIPEWSRRNRQEIEAIAVGKRTVTEKKLGRQRRSWMPKADPRPACYGIRVKTSMHRWMKNAFCSSDLGKRIACLNALPPSVFVIVELWPVHGFVKGNTLMKLGDVSSIIRRDILGMLVISVVHIIPLLGLIQTESRMDHWGPCKALIG